MSTVCKYLQRAEAAAVTWPLPAGWDETRLKPRCFHDPDFLPNSKGRIARNRTSPRCMSNCGNIGISRCSCCGRNTGKRIRRAIAIRDFANCTSGGGASSMWCCGRNTKRARRCSWIGAGATIPVYDRHTGQAWQASLFVAALGASSYTWAEATRDQQMESWLRAHVHAFEHYGGIPLLVVPDNTKTGVTKAHRYDPDLNPTYYNFALHCGFGIVPARPYKPRDKAKVESAVQVTQRWIVAALRHHKFFSLEQLNGAIRELLTKLNHRPFRKRDGSRATAFASIDKPA